MNLLQKQGFFNSIILYLGTALGFLNGIILFQRSLTFEEIGFFNLMLFVSGLYAQIASLGINSVILKYFPYFRSEDKFHGGFVSFVFQWSFIGFFLVSALYLIFKDSIIIHYQQKPDTALIVKYYGYLIPVSFFILLFTLLESLARVVYRNILSTFLREVVLRSFSSVGALLIVAAVIDYDKFLILYLFANALIVLVIAYSLLKENYFKFGKLSSKLLGIRKELVNYGLFGVLGGGSFGLLQGMAVMMLSYSSLLYVAVYSTFSAIAVVISLPAKALSRTSYQIVADAWVNQDLGKINRIYYKTSLVQLLIGCLLLIGLIANKPLLLHLLHKPEYGQYFDVFIVIGITFLVDITGGLNGQIINLSKFYKFTTILIAIAVLWCAGLNYFLIPAYGVLGAAISYLITITLLNFLYSGFLKIKFGLFPFGRNHLKVIMIAVATFIVGLFIPPNENVFIDFLTRSSIISICYIVACYSFNASEDLNDFVKNIIKFRLN